MVLPSYAARRRGVGKQCAANVVLSIITENPRNCKFNFVLFAALCHADVIAVSAGEQKMQWIPKPIRYRMDFRCQTSPAPSRFFVVSPFLALLAC